MTRVKNNQLLKCFFGHVFLFIAIPVLVGAIARATGEGGGEMATFLILNPITALSIAIFFGTSNPFHWSHTLYVCSVGVAVIPCTLYISQQIIPLYIFAYGLVSLIGVALGSCFRAIYTLVNKNKQKAEF